MVNKVITELDEQEAYKMLRKSFDRTKSKEYLDEAKYSGKKNFLSHDGLVSLEYYFGLYRLVKQ